MTRLIGSGRSAPPIAARQRDAAVVVLTLTTGAIDAVSFLRLGHVFSSVITGNLVLLGVAAGQQTGALALHAGLALGGYGAGRLALLVLAAAAMGIRSTAVRRLGQMSTTYLTSTLTGLLTGLALRRWPAEWQRSTGILMAIVAGAALGAVTATTGPLWVPAVVLVPLAAVLVFALAAGRAQPGGGR